MKRISVIAAFCIAFFEAAFSQQKVVSLNSADGNVVWQVMPQEDVAASGKKVSIPGFTFDDGVVATVPGVVFADYVDAGREENPDIADNIYRVDETKYNKPYWYRTEFSLNEQLSPSQHLWLCFDNINRYADFYFNGHKISGTEESTKDVNGHMIRSRFDVTPYYNKDGRNAIAVLVYDADQKKTRTESGPYGVACSPSYLAGAGWDWMPYVPGRLAGITGNARIEITGPVLMTDPWVRSYLPSLDKAELTVSTDVTNLTDKEQSFTWSGTITPSGITFSRDYRLRPYEKRTLRLTAADCKQLAFDHPRLWWPNGYGDPNLYQCRMQLTTETGVSSQREFRFGIKKYEYRIEKNAVDYPVLTFYVNGQRIFLKGGNWGMSHYLLRMHGNDYRLPIQLHREMNFNVIRLWTGCVTDDEFYDYCDEMGIMAWNDFWLYVAFNDVADHDAFKRNARDKVRRLRNHPSIALWCGANETHPVPDIDQALRMIVMEEDAGDRLYTSCSNQDGKSGSGWWKDLPPRHHFETSASNLAFNKPAYPYGSNYGYGCRSEIGMATFPTYESVCEFIPKSERWPLPTDEQLEHDDNTVWNRHFFGKEAWNGGPIDYRKSVDSRYGPSRSLEEFCEKAQLVNLEDMKGMFEAWNDKMWNDASALIIWMSHPAYPSFVWQTYDYYYDPTGCYWGARSACEPLHIQWNCATGSVKVINTTSRPLVDARAEMHVYDIHGNLQPTLSRLAPVNAQPSSIAEAFVAPVTADHKGGGILRLSLYDGDSLVSENTYWLSDTAYLDYHYLASLPEATLRAKARRAGSDADCQQKLEVYISNPSSVIAFATRLRLVDAKTGQRILPAVMSDGYVTLLPGEERAIVVTLPKPMGNNGVRLLSKQFGKRERQIAEVKD